MNYGKDFKNFVSELSVPILDLDKKIGNTEYIDFIRPKEVKSSVMKGIDYYDRPFIALKMRGELKNGESIDLFQTFFQRYKDKDSLWMGCGNIGINLLETQGGMTKEQFEIVKQIIEGQKVNVSDIYTVKNVKSVCLA